MYKSVRRTLIANAIGGNVFTTECDHSPSGDRHTCCCSGFNFIVYRPDAYLLLSETFLPAAQRMLAAAVPAYSSRWDHTRRRAPRAAFPRPAKIECDHPRPES